MILLPLTAEAVPEPTTITSKRLFSESDIHAFQMTLTIFSAHSHFFDDQWELVVPSSNRSARLRFPVLTEDSGQLLRVAVLDTLVATTSTVAVSRLVNDAVPFLEFLQDRKIPITNCRTSVFNLYVKRVEATGKSAALKNNRLRAVAILLEACVRHKVIASSSGIIDVSYRFPENKQPKRAPDACVIEALDSIIFDRSQPIENIYRCIYLLLRLIPNRISELLVMDRDCLSYPGERVFSISLPTAKETPFHIPVYKDYPRLLDGWCERLLYECIRQQQEDSQLWESGEDKGYLFINKNGRIVTTTDVNNFLRALIAEHHILNASGTLAYVTSHDLRHVAIGERLRSDIISPEEAMLESNHSTLEQTLAYGYASKHDEAKQLGDISSVVLESQLGLSPASAVAAELPKELPARKYDRLKAVPQTRIIPGYGICSSTSCHPRYENCVDCKSFEVNPLYLPFFEAEIVHIKYRIAELMKKHGNPATIKYNEDMLNLFERYIDLMTAQQHSAEDSAAG